MSQNHPLGWAGEVFKPVVMVVASEKATEMCKKSNLTLSQMLKPFGRRLGGQDGAVRFRTPNQGLKVVRGYGVQILSVEEITAIAGSRVASLEHVMKQNLPSEKRQSDDIFDMHDAERFFRRNPDPTPWFTSFRKQLHKSLSFASHEFTEQPIGMIVAISSLEDENPGKAVALLRNKNNLPKPLAHGLLDADIPCACWVLHDASDPDGDSAESLAKAKNVFAELESRYPSHCAMIRINSLPKAGGGTGEEEEEKDSSATMERKALPLPDIWSPYLVDDMGGILVEKKIGR
eukprot:jgi/Bigna1/133989/aug1.23_g8697